MYIMAHIDKDKYMVQDFMSLLKENKMMSVHTMVLKLKLAYPFSIKIKHLEQGFQMKKLIVYEAKRNSKWFG
jgi:hypothetical protein